MSGKSTGGGLGAARHVAIMSSVSSINRPSKTSSVMCRVLQDGTTPAEPCWPLVRYCGEQAFPCGGMVAQADTRPKVPEAFPLSDRMGVIRLTIGPS